MRFEGSESIRRRREEVRAFLLAPERVGRCLPDLQELEVADEAHFTAHVRVGVGPVRGRLRLDVALEPGEDDAEARISIQGSGLGSGLTVRSSARLTPVDGQTEVAWQAEASVSGTLATVGGRLLEGQARKVVEQMFGAIRRELEAEPAGEAG
ncbi:MAG: carbon monoxide dehydrogenase subunit G [Bacillota bacterium]|nr:carbon monoxide dehydrogenase subunit G [Bacillota bacterium]